MVERLIELRVHIHTAMTLIQVWNRAEKRVVSEAVAETFRCQIELEMTAICPILKKYGIADEATMQIVSKWAEGVLSDPNELYHALLSISEYMKH